MSILVKNKRIGISSSKVRQVCNLIRRKPVSEAVKILRFCEKREIAIMLSKLIHSGLTIANESEKYDVDNLVIDTLFVDEGKTLKRIMPRAQGRAFKINKRTSHVTMELKEK